MAQTVAHASLAARQWDERFFVEYVRKNIFSPYSGTGENATFQHNEVLTGKDGDVIHCNLVGVPRGSPNTGATAMVGNEKQQFNYGHATLVGVVRDAVVVDAMNEQASEIDLRDAARQGLRDLAAEYLKRDQINALDDRTAQGRLTEDEWNTANVDRILYGDTVAAASFDAGLAATVVFPSAEMITQAKSLAMNSGSPIDATNVRSDQNRIRPIKVGEDEEWYVLFCGTIAFAQFQSDPTISQANREAWQRYGDPANNPLFRGGDLVYDGVIVREVPDIDNLPTLSTDVSRLYLCGSQAVHVAWAQRTTITIRKETDYDYQMGVGFQEIRGITKIFWEGDDAVDLKQWGLVSVFAARGAAPPIPDTDQTVLTVGESETIYGYVGGEPTGAVNPVAVFGQNILDLYGDTFDSTLVLKFVAGVQIGTTTSISINLVGGGLPPGPVTVTWNAGLTRYDVVNNAAVTYLQSQNGNNVTADLELLP